MKKISIVLVLGLCVIACKKEEKIVLDTSALRSSTTIYLTVPMPIMAIQ